MKERLERERLETEARYRTQNDKLQECNSELDKQVRSLLDTKYALETRLAELKGKLNMVEDDLQGTQKVRAAPKPKIVGKRHGRGSSMCMRLPSSHREPCAACLHMARWARA